MFVRTSLPAETAFPLGSSAAVLWYIREPTCEASPCHPLDRLHTSLRICGVGVDTLKYKFVAPPMRTISPFGMSTAFITMRGDARLCGESHASPGVVARRRCE